MKYIIITLLCISTSSLLGQSGSTFNLSYFQNDLTGSQVELRYGVKIINQLRFTAAVATDFADSKSYKLGLMYRLIENEKFNLLVGLRSTAERYEDEEFSRITQFAYNGEFPIELQYKLGSSIFADFALIPTYSNNLQDGSIILNASVGLGVFF